MASRLRKSLKMLDVSSSYLSQVERAVTVISHSRLRQLASIYGVLPSRLLGLLNLQEFTGFVLRKMEPMRSLLSTSPLTRRGNSFHTSTTFV